MIKPTSDFQNFKETYKKGTLEIDPALANLSLEQILDKAALNFPVYKTALSGKSAISGKEIKSKSFSVYNGLTDDELGYGFTKDYVPMSYPDILGTIFEDIKHLDGTPTRVVSFANGARADIQFGFNDQQYKIGGQFHKTFYNVYAGHDGTIGIVVNSSDVRIICGNTHRMSLNDKTLKTSFKHTEKVASRLAELSNLFSFTKLAAQPYYNLLDRAMRVPVSDGQIHEFLNILIPDTPIKEGKALNAGPGNRREKVFAAIGEAASEVGSSKLNAYFVFEGVLGYNTNNQGNRSDAEQLEYVTAKTGQGNKMNQVAYAWMEETVGTVG